MIYDDELPDIVSYIAWDLVCDDWWEDEHRIRLVGGKTLYWVAAGTRNDNVRLSYFTPDLHQVNRYVKFDTLVELVKIKE